tara:strand:- start:348 stop:1301 length:954 start_codon:yes stop_codon:yes gene_type:complete
MLYNGTTIAFSTKANVWKARYSFAPTCYMTMDNDFLSSNITGGADNLGDTRMVWKHNENLTHNSFYALPSEPSTLEVVSNQNPSSVKIFKALSIESSTSGWTGSAYTNKDRGTNALQTGDFGAFVEKEGNQYSSMPRSAINSTSNLTFVGVVNVNQIAQAPTSFNENDSWDIPLINIPDVALPVSPNSFLFFGSELKNVYISEGELQYIYASDGFPVFGFTAIGYNEETNSIQVKSVDPLSVANYIVGNVAAAFATSLSDSSSTVPVYIMTNPVQDGDTMRGPYAGIKLTLPDSSEAFELFAINVDYERTKLDGSLG